MAVEVDGLRRGYGRFEAVRGVSLQVRRGELFALLGTNGAGKTTTIEVLEGLQRPSAGRVRVLGMDPVRGRAAVRSRTGVMLQSGGLTGALTVRETVEIWRSLTARPLAAAETAELVGLGERLDVAVEQLSGGEGRRLELALAVLGRPDLLFLDEPTTGMDPVSRRRTWDVIGELRSAGTTVLLTTHYLEEAEELADRVAIMHTGRVVTTGTPEEVVRALPGRITFRMPDGVSDPPTLPDASVSVEDTRVVYRSRHRVAPVAVEPPGAGTGGSVRAGAPRGRRGAAAVRPRRARSPRAQPLGDRAEGGAGGPARPGGPDRAAAESAEVQVLAASALAQTREAVHGYRAVDLGAQVTVIAQVLRSSGIRCTVSGRDAVVPPEVAVPVAAVLREASTNILRHSRAEWCTIEIIRDPTVVRMTVANDGADGTGPDRHSSGLSGLSERLADAGGTLCTTSAGGVFTVEAAVPVMP